MGGWFDRGSRRKRGTVGFCERPDGIAVAHLKSAKEGAPRHLSCFFVENQEGRPVRPLRELVRQQELAGAALTSALEAGDYSLLQIEIPEVPEAEIREAVRWQVKDLLDFPAEEAVIDYFPLPGQSRGRANTGMVIAARKSLVQRQALLFREARLKTHAIDIAELAMRNLAALRPEEEQGVAFLRLGRHSGMLTITRQSTLFLARTISIGFGSLPTDTAEAQDFIGAIALEIQRSLDFYESNFSRQAVGGIVIAPLESEFDALLPGLRNYLGARVKMLDLTEFFECDELAPTVQARCLLAVGAALRSESPNS